MTRSLRPAALAVLLAVAWGGSAPGVAAQDTAGASAAAGWEVACEPGACSARRSVRQAGTDRLVATVIVGLRADSEAPLLAVLVPLGVALPAGVKLVAGTAVQLVPYRTCVPDGCQALAEAEGEMMAALVAGTALDVQFFVTSSAQPLAAQVPTDGLEAALEEMRTRL